MRGAAGFLGVQVLLLASLRALAQEAAPAPRSPLLAVPPHLVLTLPVPALAAVATDDSSKRWLLGPLTLTLPPLLAATLSAAQPLRTADGELSTYVAFAPLTAVGPVTLNAQGAVAPKLELDCSTTCQEQVVGSLALEARAVVAGDPKRPDAALFVRSEQLSTRPNAERRLRLGVLGAF
ncbi:MAG: hypothetical protein ABI548_15490 [Polyangiaceae bacterium]